MTHIRIGADNWVAAYAGSALTCVALRTSVAVVTSATVRLGRVGARARSWVAGSRDMALVKRRAGNWITARAYTRLASIALCTSVAVVASAAVRLRRWLAAGLLLIANSDVALIAGYGAVTWAAAAADTGGTDVTNGAK